MSLLLLQLKPGFRVCCRSLSCKGSIQCGECMCKVTEWSCVLPSESTEMLGDVILSLSLSYPGHPSVPPAVLPLISCNVRKLLPQCGFQTFLSVFWIAQVLCCQIHPKDVCTWLPLSHSPLLELFPSLLHTPVYSTVGYNSGPFCSLGPLLLGCYSRELRLLPSWGRRS